LDKLKFDALSLAELIVTGDVPVAVNVTDCFADDPTGTLLNVKLVGLTVNRMPLPSAAPLVPEPRMKP
jgi:hypothetical protein